MQNEVRAVRVQVRKTKSQGYETYFVTIPKEFAKKMKITRGSILHVRIHECYINGRKVVGLLYYKPELE